jgi:hypothetical protein
MAGEEALRQKLSNFGQGVPRADAQALLGVV